MTICETKRTLFHEMCHAIVCPFGIPKQSGLGQVEEVACELLARLLVGDECDEL